MKREFRPDSVLSYFRLEWKALAAVTVSGLIYNVGLLAGPWFEGAMTGELVEILSGNSGFFAMLALVAAYVLVTLGVQGARYLKRFYVRRFANNVNRRMKQVLYGKLVRESRAALQEEGEGSVMTKAILDVDDCGEGMRKFTTEIFDTGVALAAYAGMLLVYDWRLALLCMLFPPISYYTAEKMKGLIQRAGAAFKIQSGLLSTATMDWARNGVTYRVFGREEARRQDYEKNLSDYETAAVKASVWNAAMPPVYRIVSMAGVVFILYFGQKNVLGTGRSRWDIAAFATFLSCFTKLAAKSSSAAKLFNAVHKAQVSWNRIRPMLSAPDSEAQAAAAPMEPETLRVENLCFSYPNGREILKDISFTAQPGQIIGITGPVACGKSTLGKAFLCEYPYGGSITFGGQELRELDRGKLSRIIGYLGHDPELLSGTVEENILLGENQDPWTYLRLVCLDKEVEVMEQGIQTPVGSDGGGLSGGQAQRLALARTLCHRRPVLILDDPFSALDRATERQVFENLRKTAKDSVVLLISHRLYLFPELDNILYLEDGAVTQGTHRELMAKAPAYARLYEDQKGGGQP